MTPTRAHGLATCSTSARRPLCGAISRPHKEPVENATSRSATHYAASTSQCVATATACFRRRGVWAPRRSVVAKALFDPPPFQPEKLAVALAAGTTAFEPAPPLSRRYTLTHNDITGSLRLTIGPDYNEEQISGFYTRLLRDEVVAEWVNVGSSAYALHVYCHVSGEERWLAPPLLRNYIFRREMPLVLDTLVYADRKLLRAQPELAQAQVYVHFQSTVRELDTVEYWGLLSDRGSWPKGPTSILLRVIYAVVGWPPSLSALPADLSIDLPAELRDVEAAVRQQQQALEEERRRVAVQLSGTGHGSGSGRGSSLGKAEQQQQQVVAQLIDEAAAGAGVEVLSPQLLERSLLLPGQAGAPGEVLQEQRLQQQEAQQGRSWQHGNGADPPIASRSGGSGAAIHGDRRDVSAFANAYSGNGATSNGASTIDIRNNSLDNRNGTSSSSSRNGNQAGWPGSSSSDGHEPSPSENGNGNGTSVGTLTVALTDDLSAAATGVSAAAAPNAAGEAAAAPAAPSASSLGRESPRRAAAAAPAGLGAAPALLAGRECSVDVPCSGDAGCPCEGSRPGGLVNAAVEGAEGGVAAVELQPRRAAVAVSGVAAGGGGELRVVPCVVQTDRGLELTASRAAAARSPSSV